MADVAPTRLTIDHVEIARVDWDVSPEEVLGGTGRCTATIQDRTNSYQPRQHADVKLDIPDSGWVLFRGEIEKTPLLLVTGKPWRSWRLDLADYNIEKGRRAVGALDGQTWMDPSGFGFFQNIDPFAQSLKTDKLTVQQWFDHYIRVDGEAFDTEEFVNQYIDDLTAFTPEYEYLSGALDKLAAMVLENLQHWGDPDLKYHWVTIPPWQDLAQDAVTVELDEANSTLAGMMPEGSAEGLSFAPKDASDIEEDPTGVGFSQLNVEYDGAEMPEQVYVRGGTGYVYNSPPIPAVEETKTVVKTPTGGTAGTYQLTILTTTKLWHTDGTGYVSITYESAAAGGPWPVKWVTIPWSESRNKGGNYWKFLSGPHSGLLADDNTNYLNGYGSIRVEKITTGPGTPDEPKVGIGGSGWVGEVTQDPNKRQVYLETDASTTRSLRDSIGGQTIYRGKVATLRGSVTVRGIDGWRAGQLIKITDARLPTELNGKYFIIQSVKTKLNAEAPSGYERDYTLGFGDGPKSRYSADTAQAGGGVNWPPPAIQIDVAAHDLSPGPGSTQVITGQLIDGSGKPWAISGKTVDWSFECYNRLGVLQTGQGSIAPTVSITDKYGRARTKLTTGAGTNLVYYVFADVKAT